MPNESLGRDRRIRYRPYMQMFYPLSQDNKGFDTYKAVIILW